ncbi:hypothetical protein [Sinorhizobium medicae]|uniref:hypothetical protein n=1 Tax=Sinorhizobium medicae TaxID=110321 RepID=UPI000FD90A66|nr:hypothetical protein [Sinorhizobium medicae]RVP48114.1 hypothetical protein CN078_25560 [Sinorhizobium medicae]RVP75401.1 hypothetical protein CN079_19880 [Sinorhizobium medicae]UWU06627.1 hypothetical protein N2598_09535 [Sinorhizobium medicae]
MILPWLPARFEIDAAPLAGYVCRMTHDPDKIAERRRRLSENTERMRERWQRAKADLAVQELAQLTATSVH